MSTHIEQVEPADRCPRCQKVYVAQFIGQSTCPGHIRIYRSNTLGAVTIPEDDA
jgi:hypothetical protein